MPSPADAPAADNRAAGRLRAPEAVRVDSPRLADLRTALASSGDAALQAFWQEVEREGTPLIEPAPGSPDERVYTFVWRGSPDTQAVLLLANRITDRRDLSACALAHQPGTDVWHISFRLGSDWQASYQLGPDVPALPEGVRSRGTAAGPNRAGAEDVEQPLDRLLHAARPDPLARAGLTSLWNGPAMSAAIGPDAVTSAAWAAPARRAARGRTTLQAVPWGSGERDVWVHRTPGRPAGRPLDLLVVLDGQNWAQIADLPAALDALCLAGELDPVLVVLPRGLDGPARNEEFGCNPRFLDALRTQLLPWVRQRHPVSADPRRCVIAGQSMGGLAAVWAAATAPDLFGAAASQSGSFWWRSHDPADPDAQWLTTLLAGMAPGRLADLRIDLAVGTRESLLLEPTRRLAAILRDQGAGCALAEVNGGHDLLWWRHSLIHALGRLLPPLG